VVALAGWHKASPYKAAPNIKEPLFNVREQNIKMSETALKLFVATVQKEGAFTFVAIPFSPREVWGARPRYPVSGTINDNAVSGTLGALGQDYFLRLAAAWMRDSGIEPGAEVTVKLSIAEPRLASSDNDNVLL